MCKYVSYSWVYNHIHLYLRIHMIIGKPALGTQQIQIIPLIEDYLNLAETTGRDHVYLPTATTREVYTYFILFLSFLKPKLNPRSFIKPFYILFFITSLLFTFTNKRCRASIKFVASYNWIELYFAYK